MDHAARVQHDERVEDLDRDRDDALGLERTGFLAHRVELAAFELVHHDERATVLGRAGVVDADERGMAERRGLAGLAYEAIRELAIVREPLVEDLHRARAAQHRMLGAVYGRDA